MNRLPLMSCVGFCLIALVSPSLSANEPVTIIEWRRAPECGSVQDVEAKLRNILGDAVQEVGSRRFIGSIIGVDGKWMTTIEVVFGDSSYRRSVTVSSCDIAMEISALLVALVLNPMRVLESPDPLLQENLKTLNAKAAIEEPSTQASVETEPADEVSDKPEAPAPATRPEQPSTLSAKTPLAARSKAARLLDTHPFQAGLSFAADVGTLSTFGPGISISLQFQARRLAALLAIRYLALRDLAVDGSDTATWSPQLLGLSLGAGPTFGTKPIRITPMLGAGGHWVFAESTDVARPGKASIWMASAWLGAALDWRFAEHFGFMLLPMVHYLFTRPRFVIEGIGLVHQPSRVAGVLTAGVFFAF